MYSDIVISWYSRRSVMYTKRSVEVSAVGAIPRNQDYENFTLIFQRSVCTAYLTFVVTVYTSVVIKLVSIRYALH